METQRSSSKELNIYYIEEIRCFSVPDRVAVLGKATSLKAEKRIQDANKMVGDLAEARS